MTKKYYKYYHIKHYQILIIIITCLVSCQSRNKITGLYTLEDDMGYIGLELKPDSVFVYNIETDLIRAKSEGVWKYNSGNLTLQSYESYNSGIVENSLEDYKKLDSIHIKVCNEEGGFPFHLGLNNQDVAIMNEEGEIKIPHQPIESIQIYYIGEKYNYNFKNKNSDFIELKIRLTDLSKIYLTETSKIQGNKIILDSGEKLRKR